MLDERNNFDHGGAFGGTAGSGWEWIQCLGALGPSPSIVCQLHLPRRPPFSSHSPFASPLHYLWHIADISTMLVTTMLRATFVSPACWYRYVGNISLTYRDIANLGVYYVLSAQPTDVHCDYNFLGIREGINDCSDPVHLKGEMSLDKCTCFLM